MSRRFKVVLTALFILVNLAGGVYAAVQAELLHAAVHAGLLLVGLSLLRRFAPARSAEAALPRDLADRFTRLEQSIDAIAIEVERIGEGQRFMTRFFTENSMAQPLGQGAAEAVEVKSPEAQQNVRGY